MYNNYEDNNNDYNNTSNDSFDVNNYNNQYYSNDEQYYYDNNYQEYNNGYEYSDTNNQGYYVDYQNYNNNNNYNVNNEYNQTPIYNQTNYNNINNISNKKGKKTNNGKFVTMALTSFYVLCFLFICIAVYAWWDNKETFYLTTMEVSMITNDNYQIGVYGKTEPKKNNSYKYTSTNPDIITVDEKGNIHSVSEGEAEIIVKSKYSSKTNKLKVSVEGDSIFSVAFAKDKINMDLEEKVQLRPIVNNLPSFKADYEWKVDNNRIAVVSSSGVITARTSGTTYVTCTVRGTKVSTKLRVNVSNVKTINKSTTNNNIDEDVTASDEVVNSYVGVVNVSASIAKPKIKIGEVTKLNYNVAPVNATNKNVSFSSSNDIVAHVDSKGNVRGISPGTADIIVRTKDGNKMSFATVVVTGTNETVKVVLNKSATAIKVGESENLAATVTPTNPGLIWVSQNPKIATVDSKGRIVGKTIGNTTVVVKTKDGKVSAKCNITVTNENSVIKSIKLNATNLELNKGDSYDLVTTINPIPTSRQIILYTSSNPKVVKVDANGHITAISNGSAIVTAHTNNGLKSNCNILVDNIKIKAISVKQSSVQVRTGEMFDIQTSITPSNANNKTLEYVSSNPKVATVDDSGTVQSIGLGATTISIKAKDGSGKVAKVYVAVVGKSSGINIMNKSYKPYYRNIENYLTSNKSKHMQNFAIQHQGTRNEVIYLSGVTAGNAPNPLTKESKANLSRTMIVRIPYKQLESTKKKRSIMYLKETGHGQSFDIEENGAMWTNASSVSPYYSDGRWWGDHIGAMRINFKTNSLNSNFSALAKVYPKDSSGTPYTGVDVCIDEENDLLATRSGSKVIVYRLSAAKGSNLIKIYEFNVNAASSYRQGEDILGGYYYLLIGHAGGVMTIEAYNMLGELKYTKNFYANGASSAKNNKDEPEGLKIYRNRIFIGYTHNKGNIGTVFDIGYFD